jgi:hypothetical protein
VIWASMNLPLVAGSTSPTVSQLGSGQALAVIVVEGIMLIEAARPPRQSFLDGPSPKAFRSYHLPRVERCSRPSRTSHRPPSAPGPIAASTHLDCGRSRHRTV